MIAWGRCAGLMDYNAKTGMVFVPDDGDPAGDAHIWHDHNCSHGHSPHK